MRVAEIASGVIHTTLNSHGGGAHFMTVANALKRNGFPSTAVHLNDKSVLDLATTLGYRVVGDFAYIPEVH